MRGLFRSAVALFAVGLGLLGCTRSDPGGSSQGDQSPGDAPHRAVFRVPGMT
jgi:hypothetical protein